jgi:hypothetical protein
VFVSNGNEVSGYKVAIKDTIEIAMFVVIQIRTKVVAEQENLTFVRSLVLLCRIVVVYLLKHRNYPLYHRQVKRQVLTVNTQTTDRTVSN